MGQGKEVCVTVLLSETEVTPSHVVKFVGPLERQGRW